MHTAMTPNPMGAAHGMGRTTRDPLASPVPHRRRDGRHRLQPRHRRRRRAALRCKQVDIDQAYDSYLEPASGRISLADWVTVWEAGHQAGPAKRATYDSYLRTHILPRFGDTPINKITRQDAKVFVKHLHSRLADRTVADVMSLLSLLLREAVADRRIGFNPCHGIRVSTGHRVERTPATAQQINAIADRIRRRSDQILVITAAYTGMRWGELAGLGKANTHLGDGFISIHSQVGALHEVGGHLYLGPPKSAASVRDIHLPRFLVGLLQEVIDSHDHELVFCGAHGAWLRRSAMTRRVWRPAVDVTPSTGPILDGMHFHDRS